LDTLGKEVAHTVFNWAF